MTEEQKERERERKRASAKRHRESENARQRKYIAAHPELRAYYRRRYSLRKMKPHNAKKRTIEIMAELQAKAPRHHGREEIIAAATMFVLEGDTVEVALAKASKQHNAETRIQRSSTNFEEAYWL
jgi:hypothetical protein